MVSRQDVADFTRAKRCDQLAEAEQFLRKIDPGKYPKGVKVSDKVAALRLERDKFHGEWNYTILPRSI